MIGVKAGRDVIGTQQVTIIEQLQIIENENFVEGSHRLFLSYARDDDEPFVERLYNDLISKNFLVWWDRASLPNRDLVFNKEIEFAIDEADRLVLVVSPAALCSQYVRDEWTHALRTCKEINLVLRCDNYSDLPSEISHLNMFDFRDENAYQNQLAYLVRQLSQRSPFGPLFGVRKLTSTYVPRPDAIAQIKRAILGNVNRQVIVTAVRRTGLHGMAGIGKTVLATAVAQDCEVRRAFPDGVYWINVSQTPNLIDLQADLFSNFGGGGAEFSTPEDGREKLTTLLQDKKVLLVLDDVWEEEHATAFDVLSDNSSTLITTRNARLITSQSAQKYSLDVLSPSDAMELMARWLISKEIVEDGHRDERIAQIQQDLPPIAHEVARECGYLPMALALAAAQISDGRDWNNLHDQLQNAALDYIDHGDRSVLMSLKVSVDWLQEKQPFVAECYRKMIVFPEDVVIPEAAIHALWSQEEGITSLSQTDDYIVDLDNLALLSIEGEANQRKARLHDLQRDYLDSLTDDYIDLHKQILNGYRQKCSDGWSSGPDDGYYFQNLIYHLKHVGMTRDIIELLASQAYCNAKIKSVGLVSLLNEFRDVFALPDLNPNDAYLLATRYRSLLQGYKVGFRNVVREVERSNYYAAFHFANSMSDREYRLYSFLYIVDQCNRTGTPIPEEQLFWHNLRELGHAHLYQLEIDLMRRGMWPVIDRYVVHIRNDLKLLFTALLNRNPERLQLDQLLARLQLLPDPTAKLGDKKPPDWIAPLFKLVQTIDPQSGADQLLSLFKRWTSADNVSTIKTLVNLIRATAEYPQAARALFDHLMEKLDQREQYYSKIEALIYIAEDEVELEPYLNFLSTVFEIADDSDIEHLVQELTNIVLQIRSMEDEESQIDPDRPMIEQMINWGALRGKPHPRKVGLKKKHLKVVEDWILSAQISPLANLLDDIVEEASKIGSIDVERADRRFDVQLYLHRAGEVERAKKLSTQPMMVGTTVNLLGDQATRQEARFAQDEGLMAIWEVNSNHFIIRYVLQEIVSALLAWDNFSGTSTAKRLAQKARQVKHPELYITSRDAVYLEDIANQGKRYFTIAVYDTTDMQRGLGIIEPFLDELSDHSSQRHAEFIDKLLNDAVERRDDDPQRFDHLLETLLERLLLLPYVPDTNLKEVTAVTIKYGNDQQLMALDAYIGVGLPSCTTYNRYQDWIIDLAVTARLRLGHSQCWSDLVNNVSNERHYKEALCKVVAKYGDLLLPDMKTEWLETARPYVKDNIKVGNAVIELLLISDQSELAWHLLTEWQTARQEKQQLTALPRATARFLLQTPEVRRPALLQRAEDTGILPASAKERSDFVCEYISSADDKLVAFKFIDEHNFASPIAQMDRSSYSWHSAFETLTGATIKLQEEDARYWLERIFSWFEIDPMKGILWNTLHDDPSGGNSRSNAMGRIYGAISRCWPEVAYSAGRHYLRKYDWKFANPVDQMMPIFWQYAPIDVLEDVLLNINKNRSLILNPINNRLLDAWFLGALKREQVAIRLIRRHETMINKMIEAYPNDNERAATEFCWAAVYVKANDIFAGHKHIEVSMTALIRNENRFSGWGDRFMELTQGIRRIIEYASEMDTATSRIMLMRLRSLIFNSGRQSSNIGGSMSDLALDILEVEIKHDMIMQQRETFDFVLEMMSGADVSFWIRYNLQQMFRMQTKTPLIDQHRNQLLALLDRFYAEYDELPKIAEFIRSVENTEELSAEWKNDVREHLHKAVRLRPELSEVVDTVNQPDTREVRDRDKAYSDFLQNLTSDSFDMYLARIQRYETDTTSYLADQWAAVLPEVDQSPTRNRHHISSEEALWEQFGISDRKVLAVQSIIQSEQSNSSDPDDDITYTIPKSPGSGELDP